MPINLKSICTIIASLFCEICVARDVLTNNYDNFRTGANLHETALNIANVNPTSFGRMRHFAVDGPILVQPLIVEKFPFPDGKHR